MTRMPVPAYRARHSGARAGCSALVLGGLVVPVGRWCRLRLTAARAGWACVSVARRRRTCACRARASPVSRVTRVVLPSRDTRVAVASCFPFAPACLAHPRILPRVAPSRAEHGADPAEREPQSGEARVPGVGVSAPRLGQGRASAPRASPRPPLPQTPSLHSRLSSPPRVS